MKSLALSWKQEANKQSNGWGRDWKDKSISFPRVILTKV